MARRDAPLGAIRKPLERRNPTHQGIDLAAIDFAAQEFDLGFAIELVGPSDN